jgi:hypothetical protein
MVSQSRPELQAAPMAAITFSTWKPMLPLRVMGISRSGMLSRQLPSAATTMASPSTHSAPALRAVRGHHRVCESEAKKMMPPGHLTAMAVTMGSAAFSTA